MKTDEFNRGYEIVRKSKGVKAMPKHAHAEPVTFQTADGTDYDPMATYYFFDAQTQEVRQSLGLRRDGTHLCTFGLRVVLVDKLRLSQNDALTDGQEFFKSEITRLQKRIADYELQKTDDQRSLKAFLMAKE